MKNIYWICSLMLIIIGLVLIPWFAQAAPPVLLPPPPVTAQPTATPTATAPPTAPPTATPARPTSTPQPVPQAEPSSRATGAWIELHLVFPEDWPWACLHGQTLFTALARQDAQGVWHPVAGWQGALDAINVPEIITADTPIWGRKGWWVPQSSLGQGPFRWLVYTAPESILLTRSASFYLPGHTGQRLGVRVMLSSHVTVPTWCATPTGKKIALELTSP